MFNFIYRVALVTLWFIGMISDVMNDKLGWFLADILAFPVGILRGLLEVFGYLNWEELEHDYH